MNFNHCNLCIQSKKVGLTSKIHVKSAHLPICHPQPPPCSNHLLSGQLSIQQPHDWSPYFQSCSSLSQCPQSSQNHLLRPATSRPSPAELLHWLPSSPRKFSRPAVRQNATLACISQLISRYFSPCWSCFGGIALASVSWGCPALPSLRVWICCPLPGMCFPQFSDSWSIKPQLKGHLFREDCLRPYWALVSFLAWHAISFMAHIIICDCLSTVYLLPQPQADCKPMVFSALFLSWVWYYSTTSDTKRAVQEIFLKWVNSNEGISSQGQQTKCGLEVKRCWAWKPFPKKHFAPWSLWSYFYVFSRSLPPSTTPLKATSALEYFPLWRY